MTNILPNFDSYPVLSTFTITPSTSNVNEGGTVTFSISSPNYGNGILYWTISGTVNANDFSDTLGLSGTIFKQSGVNSSIVKTLSNDATFESVETFIFELRTYSITGTIIAVSPTITINDTSTPPLYSVLVGGGGAGGKFYPVITYSDNAGGGGGGGGGVLVTDITIANFSTYYVIVGDGGDPDLENNSGKPSQVLGKSTTVTASGGGGGGTNFVNISGTAYRNGAAGGSGGGGSSPINRATGAFSTATNGGAANQVSPGKGNAGGGTGVTSLNAGGGGGAGTVGKAGNAASAYGRGGDGYTIPNTNGTDAFDFVNTVTGAANYFTFNGTSNLISIPTLNNTKLDFAANNFTIEAWINPKLAVQMSIINNSSGTPGQFGLDMTSTRYLSFTGVTSSAGGPAQYLTVTGSSQQIILNQWNHVAVVRDGSLVKLFVNGNQDATTGSINTASFYYWSNQTKSVRIGVGTNPQGNNGYFFNGSMSNVRIVKETAIYTGSFTPSKIITTSSQGVNSAKVALLTLNSSVLNDASVLGNTVTPTPTTATMITWYAVVPFANEVYGGGGDGWNAFESPGIVSIGGGGLYNGGNPQSGTPNTGGGGAGGNQSISAGRGGSGIAKFSYKADAPRYYGGEITRTTLGTSLDLIVHTFTSSGFLSTYQNPTFSVTSNVSTVYEGASITYTITTTEYNEGILGWIITGVNADTINGSMKSLVTITGNTATVIVITKNNTVVEDDRNLVFKLYTPDYVTELATATTITSENSVLVKDDIIITVDTTSVNEPGTVNFSITSSLYAGLVYWTVQGSGILSGDFTPSGVSGTFTMVAGVTVTVTKNITADLITEGPEIMWLSLAASNYEAAGGLLLVKSPNVTINDTSRSLPTVVSVSLNVGPTSGGTITSAALYDSEGRVTITGTGFSDVNDVQFGGVSSATFTVVSSTQITAVPPPQPSITSITSVSVNVIVGPGNQVNVSNTLYSYRPAPTISSITPASFALDGGQSCQVVGEFFDNTINLVIQTNSQISVITSFTASSSTSKTFIVPLWNIEETATLKINTYGGHADTSITFAYQAPEISSLSSNLGPIGGGQMSGSATSAVPTYNQSATISVIGYRFTSKVPATTVSFGSTDATITSSGSTTLIVIPPAASSAGSVAVTVTTYQGSVASGTYNYLDAPIITSISPSYDRPSGTTTTYTISGSNFDNILGVSWDNYNVGFLGGSNTPVLVDSNTITFKFNYPTLRTTNNHIIRVYTKGGISNTSTISLANAPTISSISPARWNRDTTPIITITGTNLNLTQSITFNGVSAVSFNIVNTTTITVTAPNLSVVVPGNYTLTVTDVLNSPAIFSFRLFKTPVIDSLSVSEGGLNGGKTITVYSTDLWVNGASIVQNVTFGSKSTLTSPVTNTSGTTATTPAFPAAGTVQVRVITTSDWGTQTSNALDFNYGNYLEVYTMLIGGGGGGGSGTGSTGGGGGGGGQIVDNTSTSYQLTIGETYQVNIGAGGVFSLSGSPTSIVGTNVNALANGGGVGTNGTGGASNGFNGGSPSGYYGGGGAGAGGSGSNGSSASSIGGTGGGWANKRTVTGGTAPYSAGGGGGAYIGRGAVGTTYLGVANGGGASGAGGSGYKYGSASSGTINTGGGGGGGGGIGLIFVPLDYDLGLYGFYSPYTNYGFSVSRTSLGTSTQYFYHTSYGVWGYYPDTSFQPMVENGRSGMTDITPTDRIGGISYISIPGVAANPYYNLNNYAFFIGAGATRAPANGYTVLYVAAASYISAGNNPTNNPWVNPPDGFTAGTIQPSAPVLFMAAAPKEGKTDKNYCNYIGWKSVGASGVRIRYEGCTSGLPGTADLIWEVEILNVLSPSGGFITPANGSSVIKTLFIANKRATYLGEWAGGSGGSGRAMIYYYAQNNVSNNLLTNSVAQGTASLSPAVIVKAYDFTTTTTTVISAPNSNV